MRPSVIFMAALIAATPALADGPKPFKDFTFKRIKPPESGTRKRITVQIEPTAPEEPPGNERTAPEAPEARGPRTSRAGSGPADWFWTALPQPAPGMGAVRMQAGLKAVSGGGVRAPRLDELSKIASAHGASILKATVGTGVSPAFALAVIAVESGGRTTAVSSAGATGLMQLMPATAERFGVSDATVADENIRGGVTYLDWLLKEFDGDPILALAGYNAGEGAVKRAGGVPDYPETRIYVPKVLAAWNVARGLCLTPPQLVSDGCVFVTGGGA